MAAAYGRASIKRKRAKGNERSGIHIHKRTDEQGGTRQGTGQGGTDGTEEAEGQMRGWAGQEFGGGQACVWWRKNRKGNKYVCTKERGIQELLMELGTRSERKGMLFGGGGGMLVDGHAFMGVVGGRVLSALGERMEGGSGFGGGGRAGQGEGDRAEGRGRVGLGGVEGGRVAR